MLSCLPVAGDKGLKQDDDDAHEGGHDVLYIFIILALCGYVGYSKGWHDKVLQKMRGTKIGVAMVICLARKVGKAHFSALRCRIGKHEF